MVIMKSIEKVFVSNKYTKEMESIEKEIDGLQNMLPDKLENMTGEKQIEIMKKLFSKKHGIMNRLAATDDSSDSEFNQIARRINDHSDNPLNIHKNNILEKADYLRGKFREEDYHKNISQCSKLRNDKVDELENELENIKYSFARENGFSINDVVTAKNRFGDTAIIVYDSSSSNPYVLRKDEHSENIYNSELKIWCRRQYVKKVREVMDRTKEIEKEQHEIVKKCEEKINQYTKEEIKNILRATSDYTDFIKCVKNEFADYYKKQSKLSAKTLGGEQKRRFAQICMNLKYNPPTEEQIRRQILELKAKALKRASKVTNAVLDEMSIDLIREN